jgi:hypothetical protein
MAGCSLRGCTGAVVGGVEEFQDVTHLGSKGRELLSVGTTLWCFEHEGDLRNDAIASAYRRGLTVRDITLKQIRSLK